MDRLVLETVQWASLPDVNDVDQISDHDYEVLAELRQVLKRHGYTSRFGVCLLHRHFVLQPDEWLMEYTDTEGRCQRVVVEKRQTGAPGTIETMWRFLDETQVTVCEQGCEFQGGHRRVHRKVGR